MEDLIKKLQEAGFTPEENKDMDFRPITGKYICRIDRAGRIQGTSTKDNSEYDFYAVNLQITERVDGDKAVNRFVNLNYNADLEGVKKLRNDLFTAGIPCEVASDEEFAGLLEELKDKTLNLRCWTWTPETTKTGEAIPEDKRKTFQMTKVVKAFKEKKKAAEDGGDPPF